LLWSPQQIWCLCRFENNIPSSLEYCFLSWLPKGLYKSGLLIHCIYNRKFLSHYPILILSWNI
jgi:hypothetical protein